MKMDQHEVIKLLQSQQINPTRQRVDIAQLLFARPQHLCADQVIDELADRGRGRASKATVYNTLNLFSRHGLLRELYLDAGKVYFDSNTDAHHHIYNVDTGELWDVAAGSVEGIPSPLLPDGTITVGVEVIYRVKGA
jgi:Fur family iron response transcriptional regulator